MTEESEEMSMAWGGALRDFFSVGYKRGVAKILRKPRVVIIQGRPVTTETQGFDSIVGTDGRLVVNDGFGGTTWDVIYDSTPAGGADRAGNDPLIAALGRVLGVNGGFAGAVWDIRGIQLGYNAVGAAARNISFAIATPFGLAPIVMVGGTPAAYASTVLNLAAGQYGGIYDLPNGIESVNTNGALAYTAARSITPCIIHGDDFCMSTTFTNGLAADTWRLVIIGRRVA